MGETKYDNGILYNADNIYVIKNNIKLRGRVVPHPRIIILHGQHFNTQSKLRKYCN